LTTFVLLERVGRSILCLGIHHRWKTFNVVAISGFLNCLNFGTGNLQKSNPTFPGGRFAVGLLILRLAATIGMCFCGGILLTSIDTFTKNQISNVTHMILGLVLISGSIFVMLGFMMRFVSITAAVCELMTSFMLMPTADMVEQADFCRPAFLLLAGIAIALTLLGPGALSIDSRRYGYQRIFIPTSEKRDKKET
jgi:uncharacterized membrane protein YphA (DoxX/SURF4 family)